MKKESNLDEEIKEWTESQRKVKWSGIKGKRKEKSKMRKKIKKKDLQG